MATDQQLELMRSIPLFAEVGKRDLKRLPESAVVRQYGPGDEIVEEGQRGVGMFVIVQGDVEATRQGTKVADLVPGTYFGELALFEDVPRNATVRAKTDVTCLVFRRWDFLAELRHGADHGAADVGHDDPTPARYDRATRRRAGRRRRRGLERRRLSVRYG